MLDLLRRQHMKVDEVTPAQGRKLAAIATGLSLVTFKDLDIVEGL